MMWRWLSCAISNIRFSGRREPAPGARQLKAGSVFAAESRQLPVPGPQLYVVTVNQLLGRFFGGLDALANQINSHLDVPVLIKEISAVTVHRLHLDWERGPAIEAATAAG
jgi:hypothetical protein